MLVLVVLGVAVKERCVEGVASGVAADLDDVTDGGGIICLLLFDGVTRDEEVTGKLLLKGEPMLLDSG